MAQAGFDKSALVDIQISMPLKNNQPNLEEQKRIVDKLDEVSLLQEKVSSEIKEADSLFTTVCIKEFSEIRKTKNLKRLGEVCDIVKGKFPTLKTPEGKYPFVVTAEGRKSANDYQFDAKAVCIPLVSSTGHGKASLHRIHYQEGKFALANIMVASIPKAKEKIIAKYLYYYLSFYRNDLLVPLMRGTANVTIPLQSIGEVVIPIPDMATQRKLLSVLKEIEDLNAQLIKQSGIAQRLLQSVMCSSYQLRT